MNGNPPPPKKEVALALLERGSVHVHLDPRASGVVVPAWFKRQPQLVLQVGLNMPVPIPDLRVDEDGMSCTLSFNRSPFFCIVPWSSVYAMVGDDGRGMVWPEDVPPEVALQGRAREAEQAKKPPPERQLAVVKSSPETPQKAPATLPKRKPRTVRAEGSDAPPKEATEKKARAKKPRASGADAPKPKAVPSHAGDLRQVPTTPKAAPPPPRATPRPQAPAASAPAPTPPQPRPERASPLPPDAGPAGRRPGPSSNPPGKPGKVKREIPPYLRVVK